MAKSIIFYYSASGTTKKVAQQIAQKLGAEMVEIHPAKPYTAADLNWHDPQSRTSIEQHQHAQRVEIVDDLPDITDYNNVIIGHPIWWAIPPRMISSLIDHLDLNGKNLALFATSGGTNYDRAQANIERAIKENGYDTHVNQGAILSNNGQIDNWLSQSNLE